MFGSFKLNDRFNPRGFTLYVPREQIQKRKSIRQTNTNMVGI